MGSIENVFRILGIEPTKEKGLIKKAYAEKVKECHPEEEPEKWKQLHEAYEMAIQYAKVQTIVYIPTAKVQEGQSGKTILMEAQPLKEEKEPEERKELVQSQNEEKEPEHVSDGMEQIFQEMALQSDRKRQERQQEYQRKLAAVEKCSAGQALRKWKALFEDADLKWYCQEKEFWEILLAVIEKVKVYQKTSLYIEKQLETLEKEFSSAMELEKAALARKAGKLCKSQNRYVSMFGGKIEKKVFLISGLMIAVVFLGAALFSKKELEWRIGGEIAAYLDEKYGEGVYQKQDFSLEKFKVSELYHYGNDFESYEATWNKDSDKKVYIWIYKASRQEEVKVLCFDNFQQEEIQTDLQQELVQTVGTDKGMVYLNSSEPQYAQVRFMSKEAVYHTRYEGNLADFFEKEKEVRSEWIRQDEHAAYNILENPADNINGRCMFWFSDQTVADMRQRVENPQCSYDDSFCQKIKTIEEAYGIQVVAAAFPESYYASLKQAVQDGGYVEEYLLKGNGYIVETAPPLEVPFITIWYMSGKVRTMNPQKLEDGIYIMNEKEEETEICASVEHQEKKISITFDNEKYEDYVVILDMKQLGIETGNYYVIDEQVEEPEKYREYPYTALGEKYEAVLEGEDFLYIPCGKFYDESGSTVISIVLEAAD